MKAQHRYVSKIITTSYLDEVLDEHKCKSCPWGTWTGVGFKCALPRCMPNLDNFGGMIKMAEVKRERRYHKRQLSKNYYNYFDVCVMEGISKTRAKNAVNQKRVEGIKNLDELKPIEHLFEVFERPRKGGMVNQYGILRRHYDYFKETGEAPEISPGRPPRWKGNPDVVNINIPISKELYDNFKSVVDNANSVSIVKVSYRDMIYVAMQEFIDRRPELHNLSE